jgi:hypothetical protein
MNAISLEKSTHTLGIFEDLLMMLNEMITSSTLKRNETQLESKDLTCFMVYSINTKLRGSLAKDGFLTSSYLEAS